MKPEQVVDHIFTRFQNLNLLCLVQDLRQGQVTWGNWLSEHFLCPVAHGLSSGGTVEELCRVSQAVNLSRACHLAAQDLAADGDVVRTFVDLWDEGRITPQWLSGRLEEILRQRLDDANAVQDVLIGTYHSILQ